MKYSTKDEGILKNSSSNTTPGGTSRWGWDYT